MVVLESGLSYESNVQLPTHLSGLHFAASRLGPVLIFLSSRLLESICLSAKVANVILPGPKIAHITNSSKEGRMVQR